MITNLPDNSVTYSKLDAELRSRIYNRGNKRVITLSLDGSGDYNDFASACLACRNFNNALLFIKKGGI